MTETAVTRADHQGGKPDDGLRRLRRAEGSDVFHRSRRHLRDHGRQRLRQEYAAAPPDRPAAAGGGKGLLRDREPVGCRASGAASDSPAGRRALPVRGLVHVDDARRKHRPAAAGIYEPGREAYPCGRVLEAGAGRPRRLRGLLPLADQRRHDEAGGARPRHGARSKDTVLRRALGGSRSDHLEAARRSHPPAAGRPGCHHRHGHARAAQHFRDRQQCGLSRQRQADDHRRGRPQGHGPRKHRAGGA